MKNIFLAMMFVFMSSFASFSQDHTKPVVCDSLNAFTSQEVMKLSSFLYDLEKNDSIAKATAPNGFGLKSAKTVKDTSLLKDLTCCDSVHYYTGAEVVSLSNYIYELERRDSIRKAQSLATALVAETTQFELEEVEEVPYFETVVYFNFDSYVVRPKSKVTLDDAVVLLDKYKTIDFVIEGYTDNVGRAAYNQALSLKRAKAVEAYLTSKNPNLKPRVATLSGFGANKFVASNATAAGRAKNRRVVVKAVQ